METVQPRSVTTLRAESASRCTAGWIVLAQFAPKRARPSIKAVLPSLRDGVRAG
jgi:hypothetical protein